MSTLILFSLLLFSFFAQSSGAAPLTSPVDKSVPVAPTASPVAKPAPTAAPSTTPVPVTPAPVSAPTIAPMKPQPKPAAAKAPVAATPPAVATSPPAPAPVVSTTPPAAAPPTALSSPPALAPVAAAPVAEVVTPAPAPSKKGKKDNKKKKGKKTADAPAPATATTVAPVAASPADGEAPGRSQNAEASDDTNSASTLIVAGLTGAWAVFWAFAMLRLRPILALGSGRMQLPANRVSEGTTLMVITFLLVIYHSTSTPSVVYFPVSRVENGFYVTKIKLGNPIQEFTVRIDTGSNMSWIACSNCRGCPTYSLAPGIKMNFYNPLSSSTASPIRCSDQKCPAFHTRNWTCSTSHSSSCTYLVHDPPNNTIQGYFVLDSMHYSEMRSSSVIIGCSMLQTGAYTNSLIVFDGFIGLGSHGSILSQLSSAGVVPMMFTVCLDGSKKNASYLYFGEIKQSDIAYTPLIPSESHHCLSLQGIYVNDTGLNINPSFFRTQTMPGVVVDSVTMFAYLPHEAYLPFVNSVSSFTKHEIVQPYEDIDKTPCFWTESSVDDAFPTVKLNFAGGGNMTLYPRNYLTLSDADDFRFGWCIAWQNTGFGGKTVLGDIVLKDKVLVHDLVNKRFGWKNQECSVPVKFSSAGLSWAKYKAWVISLALCISYSVLFNVGPAKH